MYTHYKSGISMWETRLSQQVLEWRWNKNVSWITKTIFTNCILNAIKLMMEGHLEFSKVMWFNFSIGEELVNGVMEKREHSKEVWYILKHLASHFLQKLFHPSFTFASSVSKSGHSNEIHCFSSPARMLEWTLGLELIIGARFRHSWIYDIIT